MHQTRFYSAEYGPPSPSSVRGGTLSRVEYSPGETDKEGSRGEPEQGVGQSRTRPRSARKQRDYGGNHPTPFLIKKLNSKSFLSLFSQDRSSRVAKQRGLASEASFVSLTFSLSSIVTFDGYRRK